jgi:hypothetical protein
MTPDEHQLIIEMFKQQTMLYAGLVEALKSRGLLSRGDLEAFDALVSASSREALERNVEADYLSNAKILSVITGLPREDGF